MSGTLFAIILGLIYPNPFSDVHISTIQTYLLSSISIIPAYLMYRFPAILVYVVIISIISDKIGELIAFKAKDERAEIIVSGALHIVLI